MPDKSAQMKMSFGMIFSIILIVVFIAFSFFAIKKFLNIQDQMQIIKFTERLQNDVNKIWQATKGSHEVEYSLPKKIEKVCFRDADENLIFYSSDFIPPKKINHLDIQEITEKENPFCVDNIRGKIKLTLEKDFGEELVAIK